MNLNDNLKVSQSIIDEIPASKLEYHRELLFGLFLFSEDYEHTDDVPLDIIDNQKR